MRIRYRATAVVMSVVTTLSSPAEAAPKSKTCANGAADWPRCTTITVVEPPPVSTLVGPKGVDANLFTPTWADEFNTTSLDLTKWNTSIWYESPSPTVNYSVADGQLKIWPMRDAMGKFFNRTIDSDRKFQQQYGFFEIEAKLPIGKGVWPGFWVFNHDLPAYPSKRPEIDILEAYPGGGPNSGWGDGNFHPVAYASTVWIDAGVLGGTKTLTTTDLSADFHTYGMDWQPSSITFYFDGKPFYSVTKSMPDPMYVLFSLWYGSASGIPDTTTPTGSTNSLVINYVRVWQRK